MLRGHHADEGSNPQNAYSSGKWLFDGTEWSFENKSGVIIPDKHQESKKKKRQTEKKKNERISSGAMNRGPGAHGPGVTGATRHQSPAPKMDKQKQTVELEDVKNAGLEALYGASKYVSKEFLRGIFDEEIFDDFLMYLLQYFDLYFKRQAEEEKKSQSTSIEPGRSELIDHANAIERVKMAEKQLGKAYCHLVMGIGVESSHHMACGQSRASATMADRRMYENFYMFCCFFVWIAFKRQKLDHIQVETGRLLRSTTFNPAAKKVTGPKEHEDYSKFHQNRPAVSSIMYQRSPAMVAILPSPKQDAKHLFTNKPLPLSGIRNLRTIEEEMTESEARVLDKSLRVGILGEHLSGYYRKNLAPIEPDIEEGKEAEKPATQAGSLPTGLPASAEHDNDNPPETGDDKKPQGREEPVSRATTTVPD